MDVILEAAPPNNLIALTLTNISPQQASSGKLVVYAAFHLHDDRFFVL
jgi:hypothetical protein